MEKLKNYIGQLRIYSFVDLLLLFTVTFRSKSELIGVSLLWFGFLIFLEYIHRDRGRLNWSFWCWLLPWLMSIYIFQNILLLVYFALCIIYSFKKWHSIGLISPFINGGLKVVLLIVLGGFHPYTLLLVWILMSLRNLAGDFRDAGKDSTEEIDTIPVFFGYKKNTKHIYPIFLTITTLTWFCLGDWPLYVLIITVFVQSLTYNLTPR